MSVTACRTVKHNRDVSETATTKQTAGVDWSVPVMSVEQAAAVLNIGRTTAYEGVASGNIPSIRVGATREGRGGRLLVPTAALRRLLSLDDDAA